MATTNPYDPTNTSTTTGGLLSTVQPTVAAPALGTGLDASGNKVNQIPTVPTAATTTYAPATRTLGANETVAGQYNNLIGQDSPLVQMSRTMAGQQMNEKGLLNSSMALGAADAAAYQAMLPIAQADANINKDVADKNLNYTNSAAQYNTGATNDASKTNTQSMVEVAKINLDATAKTNLANIEAKYKTLMGANQSATDAYSKSMQNITDISASADMDAAAKTSAIQTQLAMLDTNMQMIGKMNDLNLGDMLNFNYDSGTGGVTNTGTAG